MNLNQNKETWAKCLKANKGGSFLDGIVLATLIQDKSHSIEDWTTLFGDWKESATEMGLNEDKKKMLMYSSYLSTYNLGMKTESKKRDQKAASKEMETTEEVSSAFSGISQLGTKENSRSSVSK